MKDSGFIEAIVEKGKQAKEKVSSAFSSISKTQLNWKPSAESWSIGQCLEHLIVTHDTYLTEFRKITAGGFAMSFWEKYSPLSGMWGRLMKDQLQEEVKIKLKAPRKIRPSKTELRAATIVRYYTSLDEFLQCIYECQDIDIDRTIITSPLLSIVTYNLRDAFQFLVQHEHRHINQAMRVKNNHQFPLS